MGNTSKNTTANPGKVLNDFLTRHEVDQNARPGESREEAEKRLMAERQKQSVKQGEKQEWLDTVDRMPVWKNGFSALPHGLVRSAVFSSANHTTTSQRRYHLNTVLSVIGPGEIRYTGQELRQDDKHLLLALTDLMRREHGNKPLVDSEAFSVTTNASKLFKVMGWLRNARSYKRLRDSLSRLNATEMLVVSNAAAAMADQKGRGFSIIQDYDFEPRSLTVRMPHTYFKALATGFTLVNMAVFESLPVGFARWLHTYVCSHKDQKKISLTALINHAGLSAPTNSTELAKRRQTIRQAITELVRAGVLRNGGIDKTDRFFYQRTPDALKAPATIAKARAEREAQEARELQEQAEADKKRFEQVEADWRAAEEAAEHPPEMPVKDADHIERRTE